MLAWRSRVALLSAALFSILFLLAIAVAQAIS
jgi:hypothetical protein